MGSADRLGLKAHKLSVEDVRWLRRIANGTGGHILPPHHRQRFLALQLIEMKLTGYVLTAAGRQELEIRSREAGLATLSRRWRHRSEELHVIADQMTSGNAQMLRDIAQQWDAIAEQVEQLERLEMSEPLFGSASGVEKSRS